MNSIMNEYGVIGSLLIDSSLFPEAAGLPDDMFSSVPLQEIFRAMRRQYEESGSFDALTIRAEAGRNCTDVTDKLIAGLMDTTPTTANLDVYLAAVKEAALARSLRKIGDDYFSSFGDDAACGCFADTTGGTGDDNYFIFESVHIMGI